MHAGARLLSHFKPVVVHVFSAFLVYSYRYVALCRILIADRHDYSTMLLAIAALWV